MQPEKCSIASAYNNPSDNLTENISWEQFDYYNKNKTKSYKGLYVNMENMNVLPQLPQPRFRARDLHALYDIIDRSSHAPDSSGRIQKML